MQLGPPHHLRAQLFALGVHFADELFGITDRLLRFDHIVGKRGALVTGVALIDVLGGPQFTPIVLDRAPVTVLAQSLIGDRPAVLAEFVGAVHQHVVADTGHQIHGGTGAFVVGVGQAQTVGERARLGAPRGTGGNHPLYLQVAAHRVLVDITQHLAVVLIGHQQAEPGGAQHLLHRFAPPFLPWAQIHQLAHIGQVLGGKPKRRGDLPAHAVLIRRHRGTQVLDPLEFGGCGTQLVTCRRERTRGHDICIVAGFELSVDPGDCPQALHPHGLEFLGGFDIVFVTQVPQRTVVGRAPARHLFCAGTSMSQLAFEWRQIAVGGGDPAEQFVPLSRENVLARLDFVTLTAQPGDLGIEQIDLRARQRQALLIHVVAHGVMVHDVHGGQLRRIAGVRLLDLFDIAQRLPLALRDRQGGTGVDQWRDLP
ncbi:Uncharacterised protein [Mycobacteroides abscessus subsp. abscessus]|nr:Uncharacterised protein [Mycobacteroides abscessus subsp. abscessus]